MAHYAKSCPRGFANEVAALRFATKEARDTYCEEAERKADCNSANQGAWPCTRAEAEKIAADNRKAMAARRKNSAENECFGSGEVVEQG
jgi:hypothetical protein